jgi:ABC-type uncharacterized transport system auxiliary subunit
MGFTLLACGMPKQGVKPTLYDFGRLPQRQQQEPSVNKSILIVPAVKAADHLNSNAVLYRLPDHASFQLQPYANSQWASPPSVLVSERLRHRLSAQVNVLTNGDVVHGHLLRVELLSFEQDFEVDKTSHANVMLRATLIHDGKLLAQQTFEHNVPAKTADAEGGIVALTIATDQSVEAISTWLKSFDD